jgi:uncharacterized protein (TIGR00304 family)
MFIKNGEALDLNRSGGKKLDFEFFYAIGVALILVGIAVVIAVIVASARGSGKSRGKVKAAGVIMIGPIPIIFGTDKQSVKAVLALALALVIALIIATVLFWLLR